MMIANWEDARNGARRRLPPPLFDYVDGAAFGEHTARANRQDFDSWILEQQVLVNVAERDLSTTILGVRHPLPFVLGPVGFAGMLAPQGEILAARAAHAAGIPFCLSMFGITSIEALRKATDGPLWFQLYVLRDPALSEKMLVRAEQAGVETLCITVDSQLKSVRERDTRSGFRNLTTLTPGLAMSLLTRPRWCWRMLRRGSARIGNLTPYPEYGTQALEQAAHLGNLIDATLTWDDIRRFRDRWRGKLVLKGILSVGDAEQAAATGADGIVVSNHGGRQLDATHSTISVLPDIVGAVSGRTEVLFDSGVRRGADVVKALALGARGVLLGRAYAYALGADGERGVARVIDLLRTEIDVTIGHMGVSRLADIHARNEQLITRRRS